MRRMAWKGAVATQTRGSPVLLRLHKWLSQRHQGWEENVLALKRRHSERATCPRWLIRERLATGTEYKLDVSGREVLVWVVANVEVIDLKLWCNGHVDVYKSGLVGSIVGSPQLESSTQETSGVLDIYYDE